MQVQSNSLSLSILTELISLQPWVCITGAPSLSKSPDALQSQDTVICASLWYTATYLSCLIYHTRTLLCSQRILKVASLLFLPKATQMTVPQAGEIPCLQQGWQLPKSQHQKQQKDASLYKDITISITTHTAMGVTLALLPLLLQGWPFSTAKQI